MTSPLKPRIDRSAQVKEKILVAAAGLFSKDGFVATGVRDIARAAEVDPAIVIRHFGSKEALFVQTVVLPDSWKKTVYGPVHGLGHRLVRLIVQERTQGLRVWAALIRSSDRPDVGRIFRSSVTELFAESIRPRLVGPDAELRAHLFAAQVQGLLTALAIVEDTVLLETSVDVLVERYGSILQTTLDAGPPGVAHSS